MKVDEQGWETDNIRGVSAAIWLKRDKIIGPTDHTDKRVRESITAS